MSGRCNYFQGMSGLFSGYGLSNLFNFKGQKYLIFLRAWDDERANCFQGMGGLMCRVWVLYFVQGTNDRIVSRVWEV